MKILVQIITLIFISASAFSQSKWIEKAQDEKESNDFLEAIKYYKKAYEEEVNISLKREISYEIASCYMSMNLCNEAIPWFEESIEKESVQPDLYYHYGNALSKSGNLKKAKKIIETGIDKYPGNIKLERALRSIQLAEKKKNQGSPIKLTELDIINTQYSEYAPAWFGDNLIFSSSRILDENDKIDGRTSQAYSDLFIASFDDENQHWYNPVKIKGPLNSKYNDGTFTFDETTYLGYVMQCNKNTSNCIINIAKYDPATNSWAQQNDISINDKEHSVGHPSINESGDILYFVSDMEGGYGGKDIWKVNRKSDGTWGLPINLGDKINTSNDEMFPFIIGDTLLFFASNGHFGIGSLDLFYSYQKDFEFSEPVNLGYPFNTPADDFAMIIKPDLSGGLFSSNRKISQSDDIYAFEGLPFYLKISGIVSESVTGKPISDAKVIFDKRGDTDTIHTNKIGEYNYNRFQPFIHYKILAEKNTYHPDSRTLEITDKDIVFSTSPEFKVNFTLVPKIYSVAIKGHITDRATGKSMMGEKVTINGPAGFESFTHTNYGGDYIFKDLKPNTSYTAKISKDGYFSESRECKLPSVKKNMTFSKSNGYDMDFVLTKIEKKKEIVLNDIYYDFDKASLRPESKVELDKLASMLKETPNVIIQISSHTDDRGSQKYNDKLSKERAQSVVNYLIHKGIDKQRMVSKGYGERQLLIKNASTEDEHQKNRRTTFKVIDITEKSKEKQVPDGISEISFRIQLMSTQQPIQGHMLFANILQIIPNTNVFVRQENQMFKYEIGTRNTIEEAIALKKKIKEIGYKDCFINAYLSGKKISIQKAKEIINANK